MLPLLFSILSGVRELSATAYLEEFQQPEPLSQLPIIPGVSSKDLIASLCPVAVAVIVATIRYYNEGQMQQRISGPYVYSSPFWMLEGGDIASCNDCGDLGTALARRRSQTFYIPDDSIVVFRVCTLSLNSMI
jgi:hypothetical protein